LKSEEEAEIFVGVKGLKSAYLEAFKDVSHNGENLFFYVHRKEYAKESDKFYISNRKLFKHMPMRGICNEEYRGSKAIVLPHTIRYANFPIPGNVEIIQDNVIIISWGTKPVAFLIRSKEIANSMREYFESVWRIAKK